jgi:organic radical activating enzyme
MEMDWWIKRLGANSHMAETMDVTIPVMEQFYTLQGEGRWTGTPAYFVRLAGCDVGCVWCDVKESWTVSPEQYVPVADIVANAVASGTGIVVVTGGEPVMYPLGPLTQALKAAGLRVHLETSGAYPFSGDFDWVTLSPKKFKASQDEYFALAHELKVIVYNRHDLKWAEEQAARCDRARTQLYLQPEWSKREQVHEIIEYIKTHPWWKLGLQTHKYVNIP